MNITMDSLQWICKSNNIKGTPNFVKGVCPHKNKKYKRTMKIYEVKPGIHNISYVKQ